MNYPTDRKTRRKGEGSKVFKALDGSLLVLEL